MSDTFNPCTRTAINLNWATRLTHGYVIFYVCILSSSTRLYHVWYNLMTMLQLCFGDQLANSFHLEG